MEQYAATEAAMLPVEARQTALAPISRALVTSTKVPRSLKTPVGLAPSFLTKRFLRLYFWPRFLA